MFARYLARRLLSSVLVVLGVTFVTFLLVHTAAGSFVPGLEADPLLRAEDVANIRRNLGLDEPLHVQYLRWIGVAYLVEPLGLPQVTGEGSAPRGLLQLDFGRSMIDGTPVIAHIAERLPLTLELTGTAVVLALIVAVPAGIAGATRRGRLLDQALTVISVAGVSVPQFWLGLVLILIFSVQFNQWGLPWLPSTGAFSARGGGDLWDHLKHLVLPAIVLAFTYVAIWSRYTRSSMIEALAQEYVRTARAKGLGETRIQRTHALPNALMPLITLVGLELPTLVSGGAIVEIVFGWPGLGRLALERALRFDITLILGLTTFASLLVVLGNVVADMLYAAVDPRVRSLE